MEKGWALDAQQEKAGIRCPRGKGLSKVLFFGVSPDKWCAVLFWD